MDGETDYVVLLKSVRHVKQQIDKFLHKNRNGIDNVEIMRIRKSVEKILNMFLSHTECNTANNNSMFVQHFNCEQLSAKSNMKEPLDISSNFCTGIDTTKSNNHKQNLSDKKECRKVTNEDCSSNKRQVDLQEKVKHLEEHIKDLDCCLRELAYFMIKLIKLSQDHQKREIRLEKTISNLRKEERRYKCRVQRLSKKLDYARRASEERQRKTGAMVSEIEQLKRMAEKNATDWSDVAKTISSVAVDLSQSCRRPTCDDRLDYDDDEDDDDDYVDDDDEDDGEDDEYDDGDGDDVNSCDGYDGSAYETKNTGGEQEASCCRSANGPNNFPVASHSTPIRSVVEDYPFSKNPPSIVVACADRDDERTALCSSGTTVKVAEKSSMKAEPPSPCRQRPSPNPFRPARKIENGRAETQLSNGILAKDGSDSKTNSTMTNKCLHCNNRLVYKNLE